MTLINCKVHLELNWIEDFILSSEGDSTKFKITDAKLYVQIVILSTKNNVNLTKELSDGFKRSIYWNNYETIPEKVINNEINIYELLGASFQSVRRLFLFAYDATNNNNAGMKNNRKYIFQRADIENYNVLINGRSSYDQPNNDLIKQYDEVRKTSIGQVDDYTTGCLLDYEYFKENYRLIAVDISKQKALDANPRAVQQIVFQAFAGQKLRLYTSLEK